MQAVLLAAGESSRFWPLSERRHKSLFALMGKPLITWTLEALERSGVKDVVVIQSPSKLVQKGLRELSTELKVKYVIQEQPQGMGDALLSAHDLLAESFVLLHAHQYLADLWLPKLFELKRRSKADLTLAGAQTDEPWKYGIFELDKNRALGIVEKPEQGSAPSDIRAVGLYLLSKRFVEALATATEDHYSFEHALDSYMRSHDVRIHIDEQPTASLKYPWDLFSATETLMKLHLKPHQATNAKISPLAHISGDVYIGENAKVYEYAVIKGPCYIGDGAIVGTHAFVRHHTNLERDVLIGAHAEVARSIFQAGSSTHSGFIGDSIFDRGAKTGAGTVTANVRVLRDEIRPLVKGERTPTARSSLGVVVGEGTQLGIGVKTMPGVLIGSHSFVGPGAIVSENVESDTRLLVKQESLVKRKRKRDDIA